MVPLADATLNEEASLLANALREKPARLSPTAVIDPIVHVNNHGIVSVAATVLNTTQTWLFGWGSRSDTCDTLGLRFIHPDGTFTAEARIQMQFECLPPGGSRRLHGAFSVADLHLEAGQYRVDFDIVREGVGWSRDQGAGSWAVINVPDKLHSLPLEHSRFTTEKRLLCLTFDGILGNLHTEELLSVLREVNVPATMFLTGRYIARFPELVKEMAEDGHELANHTYSHPILCNYGNDVPRSDVTREQLVEQLHRTEEEAERRLALKMPHLWRAPYGARNSTILSWGVEADYRHIAWNFDGQDYTLGALDKRGNYTTEDMIARLEQHLDTSESRGSILRFQLSSSDPLDPIYPAIQRIVSIAWSRGFSFRTVSEML
jgi:peptidoglycan/xylan/chitin deacetylase (PgdA/CDA1 family)